MRHVCPVCGGTTRRLTTAQAQVYLLPSRLWAWRVAATRWHAWRCETCSAVHVLAGKDAPTAACPRCERSSFVFADAVFSAAGHETVRHVCTRRACRHSEVTEEDRTLARELPVPAELAFGSARCHGDGFGGDW